MATPPQLWRGRSPANGMALISRKRLLTKPGNTRGNVASISFMCPIRPHWVLRCMIRSYARKSSSMSKTIGRSSRTLLARHGSGPFSQRLTKGQRSGHLRLYNQAMLKELFHGFATRIFQSGLFWFIIVEK